MFSSPVLHPVMAGASGDAHSVDWHISDTENGYVAPAKTLAMMAIDLLHDDAKCARQILSENKPALTKDQYLQQQKSVFDTDVYEAV